MYSKYVFQIRVFEILHSAADIASEKVHDPHAANQRRKTHTHRTFEL